MHELLAILVHSPFVGPSTWSGAADELTARGHEVVVADLRPATRAGPPFWPRHVELVAVATGAPAHPVVVVGHSGAGPLLPAIAAALDPPPAALVYVDAALPAPGESRLDRLHPSLRTHLEALAVDGVLPPWPQWFEPHQLNAALPDGPTRARVAEGCEPVPLALLTEVLPDGPADLPSAYLRLSAAYRGEEAEAAARGWAVSRLDGTHFEPVLRPAAVVDALLGLVHRVART